MYKFEGRITKENLYKLGSFDSAIVSYVEILYNIVKDIQLIFKDEKILVLELGCWSGSSARPFLATVNEINGKLISVDMVDYSNYFDSSINNWQFVLGDSKTLDLDINPHIIFLDTSHIYADTVLEIKHWLPKLKVGGIMIFHDIISCRDDVYKAIKDVLDKPENNDKIKYTELDTNFPGLGQILKLSNDIYY